MNPLHGWLVAFLLTALTAVTLVMGERHATPTEGRDPAKLTDVDAELILNRIREGDLVAIKGDLDGARAQWKQARARGEGYWPVHEALGDSYLRNALYAEAEAEYETAGRIAEKQLGRAPATISVKRADLLVRLNRPEPALHLLIECGQPDKLSGAIASILRGTPGLLETVKRAADTRDPRLWAIVAAFTSEPAERASIVGRFVRTVSPSDQALAIRAVDDLKKHGRTAEALLICETWAKAAPSNPAVYVTWGRLLAETGDRHRARLVLSTIVDVRAGNADAHLRLGSVLRDLGDYLEAIRQFEEASRLRPEEPGPMQEVAITLFAQGRFDDAAAKTRDLVARKWESRFGDVAAPLRSRMAVECLRKVDEAKRAGDLAAVARLRGVCADLGVVEAGLFDIKIILKWDADSDVDLDVTEPGGETVNHGNSRSKNGAIYIFDNTRGRGPEHYTLKTAVKGKYKVGVHLHGSTKSKVEIEVILFEDSSREKRLSARVELDGTSLAQWPLEFEIP